MSQRTEIRLSLPSKGRLAEDAVNFLTACGLHIYKPNPRQYAATIPAFPNVKVLFQRPTDIVVSVRDGSVDFGITGLDVTAEHGGGNGEVLVLHEALGFGGCRLAVAVPEAWVDVATLDDLATHTRHMGKPLRVATQFPNLAGDFLARNGVAPVALVKSEGTLEIAPAIGYADCIVDLVASGQTLIDNRLRALTDGVVMRSEAALIANRAALRQRADVLSVARTLLEFTEAHLRAEEHYLIVANMRGESPQAIAGLIFAQHVLGGLQGPTVSPVVVREDLAGESPGTTPRWHAVQVVVRRDMLIQAIAELRAIGGSGVVVTPVTYIFEEEPARYKAMMKAVREA